MITTENVLEALKNVDDPDQLYNSDNMNKINSEVKLDFSDVLIEPCISDKSLTRKSVNIEIDWLDTTAVPIVVSNMLSTGTYKIAKLLTNGQLDLDDIDKGNCGFYL